MDSSQVIEEINWREDELKWRMLDMPIWERMEQREQLRFLREVRYAMDQEGFSKDEVEAEVDKAIDEQQAILHKEVKKRVELQEALRTLFKAAGEPLPIYDPQGRI